MTAPRIWKNNYVEEDSSTDLSPGSATSKVACTTPMASPPLPCSPSTGASEVHEVANGITSLFCTHPSCGPPRSAHPHDCCIFQIYASHPWAPISVMFTPMLFLNLMLQAHLNLRAFALALPSIGNHLLPADCMAWLVHYNHLRETFLGFSMYSLNWQHSYPPSLLFSMALIVI